MMQTNTVQNPALAGKHPSFNHRPIPTFQLLSKVSKFNGQRKDEPYGALNANTIGANNNSSDLNQKYQINSEYANNGITKDNLLDPNFKKQDNQTVNPQNSMGDRQTKGTLGSLLDTTKTNQLEPDYNFQGKRMLGNTQSNANNAVIGGQGPVGDPYQSTAQYSSEGRTASLDNKGPHGVKIMSQYDPENMISPITGERIADYGSWAQDLATKRNAAELAAAEEEKERNKPDDDPIMTKLKAQLASRGAKGLIGLGRLFRIMDDDSSNSLSFAEFKKAMKECKMTLTDTELIILFKRFDRMNSGAISYNDFLNTVTGSMNARRKKLVNMAFDVLDKDGSGVIDLADIAMAYDVTQHPDYKAGKKSKDKVLMEFLEGFDVGGTKDGQVTREEFANYYTTISSSIDNDEYFELMIRNAWHISGGVGSSANSSNIRVLVTREDGTQYVEEVKNDLGVKAGNKAEITARLKAQGVNATSISTFDGGDDNKQKLNASGKQLNLSKSNTSGPKSPGKGIKNSTHKPGASTAAEPSAGIKMIICKIKDEMKKRGSGGFIGLQRRFRIMDDDGSKSLSLSEFKKALKEFKMDITEADLRMLFEHFDSDSSGSIDFEEFVQGVRDPMTERRLKLVKLAFNIIDKDGSGIVDGAEIASMYDPSKHPEVISKRKTPAQVLREFLDTFDVGGVKDGMVTQDEFINYYTNLSANIDNEDYFELMIRNAWHISGGEGQSANTTNMKVLVTDFAGTERTVTIENDLGLKKDDLNDMYKRLTRQGVTDIMALNGKVLKRVNVNGVEIVTSAGAISQIKKDDTPPVNVLKAPTFSRTSKDSSAPAIRPLAMASSNSRPPSSSGIRSATVNALVGHSAAFNNNSLPNKYNPPVVGSSMNLKFMSGGNDNGVNANQLAKQMQRAAEDKSKAAIDDIVSSTLLDVIRVQLLTRGPAGIINLQRKFIEMDTDNSKSLDRDEFKIAMHANNLTFSDVQLTTLFNYFDTDKSGTIDYSELLNGLRGQLNPKLLVLVHQTFDLMDKTGAEEITPQQLLTHFDPTRHPDVLTGHRTADEVQREFLDTFDVGGERPGKITRNEFVNYFTNICCSVNDDDYFELTMRKCWHLKENFGDNIDKINQYKQINNATTDNSSLVSRLRTAALRSSNEQPESDWAVPSGDEGFAPPPIINRAQQPRRPSSASATRRPSASNAYGVGQPSLTGIQGVRAMGSQRSDSINNMRPQSAGGVSSGRNNQRLQRQPAYENNDVDMSASVIQAELRAIQTNAVLLYNAGNFKEAELKFSEAWDVLQMMYPPNHPECLKAEKSVTMIRKKIEQMERNEKASRY